MTANVFDLLDVIIINGDLKMPKHRCIVPMTASDGMVQYYKFTGHKNTAQQLTNDPDDKFKLSEGDSNYCLKSPTTYDGKYRVKDEQIVPGADKLAWTKLIKNSVCYENNRPVSFHAVDYSLICASEESGVTPDATGDGEKNETTLEADTR